MLRLPVLLRLRLNDMNYENIEWLRLQHELTQQEVADVLGCQREVYRRYENGT